MSNLKEYIESGCSIPSEKVANYFSFIKKASKSPKTDSGRRMEEYSMVAEALVKQAQDLVEEYAQENPNQQREPDVAINPNIILSGGMTPEEAEQQHIQGLLDQDRLDEEASRISEVEYYKQVVNNLSTELEGAKEELNTGKEQAAQAQNQLQQTLQELNNAKSESQNLQAQLQAQLQESVVQKDSMMQMKQAIQRFREQLQNLALSDPLAPPPPTPEEMALQQGMAPPQEQSMPAQKTASIRDRAIGAGAGALLGIAASVLAPNRENTFRGKAEDIKNRRVKMPGDRVDIDYNNRMADIEAWRRKNPVKSALTYAAPAAIVGALSAQQAKNIINALRNKI